MRLLNMVLLVLMILFIVVQHNDPDGPLWMAIYSVPAVWAAIAVFKRQWLSFRAAKILLLVCIAVSVAGMIYFWPDTPGWWRQEVWWEVESAREGMGMMIVALVLSVVWFSKHAEKSADAAPSPEAS